MLQIARERAREGLGLRGAGLEVKRGERCGITKGTGWGQPGWAKHQLRGSRDSDMAFDNSKRLKRASPIDRSLLTWMAYV
jgi:hypothetical protein